MHEEVGPLEDRVSPAAFEVMSCFRRSFARLDNTSDRMAILRERVEELQLRIRARIDATDAFLDEQQGRLAQREQARP